MSALPPYASHPCESSAPEYMAPAKQEHVVVVGDHAVHQASCVQPGALRLGLLRRHQVGQPKHGQQRLALAVHLAARLVGAHLCAPLLRLQPLRAQRALG